MHGSIIDGVAPTFDTISSGDYPGVPALYLHKEGTRGPCPGSPASRNTPSSSTSQKAMGEDGYLPEKGLIPLSDGGPGAGGSQRQVVESAVNVTVRLAMPAWAGPVFPDAPTFASRQCGHFLIEDGNGTITVLLVLVLLTSSVFAGRRSPRRTQWRQAAYGLAAFPCPSTTVIWRRCGRCCRHC